MISIKNLPSLNFQVISYFRSTVLLLCNNFHSAVPEPRSVAVPFGSIRTSRLPFHLHSPAIGSGLVSGSAAAIQPVAQKLNVIASRIINRFISE